MPYLLMMSNKKISVLILLSVFVLIRFRLSFGAPEGSVATSSQDVASRGNGALPGRSVVTKAWASSRVPGFDHRLYNDLLSQYVTEGRVDYQSLKDKREDLDRYLESLGSLTEADYEGMTTEEKIAFWINAYNANTLKVITDHYPIKKSAGLKALTFPANSIRQIQGAWDKIRHRVLGKEMTLDEIEHETLRKKFQEPRIHMALVCAAKGCPALRSEAYAGERLNEQLDDQARSFLGNPEKFRIDQEGGQVYLSPILKWFADDFRPAYEEKGPARLKGKEKAAIGFVVSYLSPGDQRFVSQNEYKIEFLDYDWSLNENK